LLLVVALLLGSVLIPARFTSRILRVLRESHDVIEPARQSESQLELDLDGEWTALQDYALTGDTAALVRQRVAATGSDRDLAELDRFANGLDGEALEGVAEVRSRLSEWRRHSRPFFSEHLSRPEFTALLRSQQLDRDSTFSAVTRLESYLAHQAAIRGDRIGISEQQSLVVNASLVLVALAAMFAVAALVQRQRQLSSIIERRTEDEGALRASAEAFAGAFTRGGVTQEVARSALHVMRGRAAFIGEIDGDSIVVRAATGFGAPAEKMTVPFSGRLIDVLGRDGEPMLISDFANTQFSWFTGEESPSGCSAIVVPLGAPASLHGALFVLSPQSTAFNRDDLEKARTLSHLISLAYEKIRLLDEARDGRQELERVLNSRSRLMRGFSHDIKNPLGAADGYAELLTAGIYGALSPEQRASIERLRGSIHTALALINDLHELARAETGKLTLYLEPVALHDVLRASREEFRAAATARGLSLTTDLPDEPALLETDGLRVRQILSNLVSNAIKYTPSGSIVLRLRRAETETGDWALIEVEDTGRGIPEAQLPLLFEEFVRLGESDQTGAGLGLAISRRLAEVLGGRITAESEVGRGSRFVLWLPMARVHDSSQQRVADERSSDPFEPHPHNQTLP
jgi:signal transduction histidine kinase